MALLTTPLVGASRRRRAAPRAVCASMAPATGDSVPKVCSAAYGHSDPEIVFDDHGSQPMPPFRPRHIKYWPPGRKARFCSRARAQVRESANRE